MSDDDDSLKASQQDVIHGDTTWTKQWRIWTSTETGLWRQEAFLLPKTPFSGQFL